MAHQRDRQHVINGIFSGLVTICGIAFCVMTAKLIGVLVEVIDGKRTSANLFHLESPIWSIGFAFIVPGVIGVIASLSKAKAAYSTLLVFCVISLLGMGVYFVFAVKGLRGMTKNNPSCHTDGLLTILQSEHQCEQLNNVYRLSMGLYIVIIFGWIFTLVVAILSSVMVCGSEEASPGMIIQQMPPTTVVHLAPDASMPQVIGQPTDQAVGQAMPSSYMTTTNDKAGLIPNAQY